MDARNRELKAGDLILIPARIETVEDEASLRAVTLFGRHGDGAQHVFSALNKGHVLRYNDGDSLAGFPFEGPAVDSPNGNEVNTSQGTDQPGGDAVDPPTSQGTDQPIGEQIP